MEATNIQIKFFYQFHFGIELYKSMGEGICHFIMKGLLQVAGKKICFNTWLGHAPDDYPLR
jgi:hypothetical protein